MVYSQVRPIVWIPKEAHDVCYLLPCLAHHTPYLGVIGYLMNLNKDEKLSRLAPHWLPKMNECFEFTKWLAHSDSADLESESSKTTTAPNEADPYKSKKLAVIVANSPTHYTGQSIGLKGTINKLETYQISHLVLMIAACHGLSHKQRSSFYNFIGNTFGGLIHLGGYDDVDPRIYQEENLYANSCCTLRDFYEIELLRYYYYHSRGFIMGFCRGMQIANVAFGGSLHQDIKKQNSHNNQHQECTHQIKALLTKTKILSRLVDGYQSIKVNSFHHQAVKKFNHQIFEVAAIETDHTIEALEFKNGRGILFQFHPECDDNEPWHKLFAENII